jgi:hypothetical protein
VYIIMEIQAESQDPREVRDLADRLAGEAMAGGASTVISSVKTGSLAQHETLAAATDEDDEDEFGPRRDLVDGAVEGADPI